MSMSKMTCSIRGKEKTGSSRGAIFGPHTLTPTKPQSNDVLEKKDPLLEMLLVYRHVTRAGTSQDLESSHRISNCVLGCVSIQIQERPTTPHSRPSPFSLFPPIHLFLVPSSLSPCSPFVFRIVLPAALLAAHLGRSCHSSLPNVCRRCCGKVKFLFSTSGNDLEQLPRTRGDLLLQQIVHRRANARLLLAGQGS